MSKMATIHAQQKWEYTSLTRHSEKFLVDDLNKFGQNGWEMVSSLHYKDRKGEMVWTAFLKRPYAGPAPTPTAASAAQTQSADAEATTAAGEPEANGDFDLSGDEFDLAEE